MGGWGERTPVHAMLLDDTLIIFGHSAQLRGLHCLHPRRRCTVSKLHLDNISIAMTSQWKGHQVQHSIDIECLEMHVRKGILKVVPGGRLDSEVIELDTQAQNDAGEKSSQARWIAGWEAPI